jgi:thiamine biosynthesis lipoprotein
MNYIRIIIFYLLIFLPACSNPPLFKETRVTMDTVAEISCWGSGRAEAVRAMDAAFKEMERIERVFSKFGKNSEVSRINSHAGAEEVVVSSEVLTLIQDSIYYSKISNGSFDITVGPLMEIWGFVHKNHTVPSRETIENNLRHVGYRNIFIDIERSSIRFLDKDTKIDLGAIAKGYAVDRARQVLISHGIKNSLINLGGNIFAMGQAPGDKNWKIGVQDPRNKNRLLQKLELKDKAVSTSGNYERFFILNGKRYSHIINPVTGEPCQGIISVTVVTDSAEASDALSTAIFVMGIEKGIELARSLKDIEVAILDEYGKITSYP